jgi:hypothetical protein
MYLEVPATPDVFLCSVHSENYLDSITFSLPSCYIFIFEKLSYSINPSDFAFQYHSILLIVLS